ncbi:MAG: hypothetical protein AAB522_00700 [Patescibacteria group bacterium]
MRKLVLGKNWYHAIRVNPKFRQDSSMPEKRLSALYNALLYNPNTKGSCCVGLYLNQCGVPNTVLANNGTALALNYSAIPEEAKWLIEITSFKENSEDARTLYGANDGVRCDFSILTPEKFKAKQREIIRAVFAKHNVEVIFEDEQQAA